MKIKFRSVIVLAPLLILTLSVPGWAFNHFGNQGPYDDDNGQFLMMSDIHLDPFADPVLVKQLIAAPVEEWEKILSKPREPFAPYGKDANYTLMISALSTARDKGPYDFAIVTGDYLVHDSRKLFEPYGGKDEQAYEDFVTKVEIFVSREFQKYLPNTRIYFSLGNNDSECGDYMMATHTRFLDVIGKEWERSQVLPEAQKTMRAAGYYISPNPSLPRTRMVVLNDIYWSNRYSEDSCHAQPNDWAGAEEMKWLEVQLAEAKTNGQKIALIMHIPPQADLFSTFKAVTEGKRKEGKLFWDKKYEKAFVDLMRKYAGTVAYCFAGHTHMDDFRLMEDKNGKPFLMTHLCPAVSPIRGNNPAFQTMDFDKNSGALQDMRTYYLDLARTKNGEGSWELEYDFNDTYGLKGYNVDSLTALTQTLDSDPAKLALFTKYYIVSTTPIISADSWRKLNDLRLLSSEKEMALRLKELFKSNSAPTAVSQ